MAADPVYIDGITVATAFCVILLLTATWKGK